MECWSIPVSIPVFITNSWMFFVVAGLAVHGFRGGIPTGVRCQVTQPTSRCCFNHGAMKGTHKEINQEQRIAVNC